MKKAATKKTAPKKRTKKSALKKEPLAREVSRKNEPVAPVVHNEAVEPVEENSPKAVAVDPETRNEGRPFDKPTNRPGPQHLQLSNKPKGGVKPSGKKPLWN